MPYAPTSLSFNAAFLREIKEDNRRLQELLVDTATLLRRYPYVTTVDRQCDIVRQLVRLRDQLALHFALENAFGYLVDVVEHAPRLCSRALGMIAQHDELFLELCELIDIAESVLYEEAERTVTNNVARGYFRFQQRFYAHEAAENELLLDVFDCDIGVGD